MGELGLDSRSTKAPTKAIKLEPGKWFHSLAVCLEHNDLGRSDWRNAVSFQPQFCHPEPASRGWHVTGLSPMRARLGDALHTRKPEIMGRNKVWTITENGHSVRCVVWYRTGLFILTFFFPPPPSAPSCSFSSFPFLLCLPTLELWALNNFHLDHGNFPTSLLSPSNSSPMHPPVFFLKCKYYVFTPLPERL